MNALVTTNERIAIVRRLPRRLQRRAEGLDPVRLRLALEAMQVPEYDERSEILQCAPPPMGLGRTMYTSGGAVYPPPNTYANCFQWLTPAQATSSGGNLTAWQDLSGYVGSGVTAPLYNSLTHFSSPAPTAAGTIGGQPGITYVTNNWGSTATGTTQPFYFFATITLFAVVAVNLSGGSGTLASCGVYDNDYINSFLLCGNVAGTNWKFIMNDSSSPYGLCESTSALSASPQIIACTFQGSSHAASLWVNGTQQVTDTTMSTPTGASGIPITVGRNSGGSQFGMPGEYGDFALFLDVKAGTNMRNLHRYFGAKYGITVP